MSKIEKWLLEEEQDEDEAYGKLYDLYEAEPLELWEEEL